MTLPFTPLPSPKVYPVEPCNRAILFGSAATELAVWRLGGARAALPRPNRDMGKIIDEPVQLELMGRRENFDVIEIPENVPSLLGQVPLEILDLVVDPRDQRLIPNPAHGGEQMTEEFTIGEGPPPTCPYGTGPNDFAQEPTSCGT